MPTELPPRKIAPPESTTGGMLFCVAAVLLMLVISAGILMHPEGIASDTAQAQGL